MVAGSTWPEDEEFLTRFINESDAKIRFIIAPHEITPSHIQQLTSRISKDYILFSRQLPGQIIEQHRYLSLTISACFPLYTDMAT